MLSDLRDSGSIEQDADTVLFIYRDDYYKTDKEAGQDQNSIDIVECIVAKNRHGSTGSVKLSWSGRIRFSAASRTMPPSLRRVIDRCAA